MEFGHRPTTAETAATATTTTTTTTTLPPTEIQFMMIMMMIIIIITINRDGVCSPRWRQVVYVCLCVLTGVSNILGSFVSAYPVTGSFSRYYTSTRLIMAF